MDNINSLIKKTSDIDVSANFNLKDTDVIQIWDEVSSYIDRFMSQSKGISITGFGTFTFVQKKIDIGNNKFVLVQRPIFDISEKFAKNHGLTFTKYPAAGNIPVHPLNYAAIANETAFTRDNIELCVKHVLQVFNRSVQSRKNVEFTFTGIGKLQIRNSKVKMKFFKEFVNSCDATGKALTDMQNRPHTADSVMSRNETRLHSRNTCVLPRINSRAGANSVLDNENNNNVNNGGVMDTISEEPTGDKEINQTTGDVSIENKVLAPVATIFSSEDAQNSDSLTSSIDLLQQAQAQPQTTTTNKYHIPYAFESSSFIAKSEPGFTKNEAEAVNAVLNADNANNNSSGFLKKPELIRPSSKSLLNNITPKPVSSAPVCGHQNSGQELCYLCHQRHRRNVPVYLHEEVKLKEKEENQMLMQYQHMKDVEKILKDQEKQNERRLDRAKVDAFNLGVTEAIKLKRNERPKTSDISRSFVFRKRCKTPPKFLKQQELGNYLSMQIDSKQRDVNLAREEKDYIEKMEQLQLAEELAAQREYYLKEKKQRKNELKNALDYQVKNKPNELPKALPDSEVFGQYDQKNERLALMKRKEIETFKFHKDLVEQRKREELLKQVKEQELDAENIERVKEEYRIDRANRYKRIYDMRKTLENDWVRAHEDKIVRDVDEREHRYAHDGTLVHEQCDKYKRCAQCKRDMKNCGETNLWCESRYIPGSRLMV